MRKGFSLLESLIGLTIMFLVVCGSLESFGTARRVFYRLRLRQENSQAAWAALDKIRFDIRLAGQGLLRPMRLGLVSAFEADGSTWVFYRGGGQTILLSDASAGQTYLEADAVGEDWDGRTVCLFDRTKGETAVVVAAAGGRLELAEPLTRAYPAAETRVIVLRQTSFYLDGGTNILRRKADASPAQPLCEGVGAFSLSLDSDRFLAEVRLSLSSAPEKIYGLSILAPNAALGPRL
jgi:hypothetical protein